MKLREFLKILDGDQTVVVQHVDSDCIVRKTITITEPQLPDETYWMDLTCVEGGTWECNKKIYTTVEGGF
jgi:hypothetical protein